MEETGYTTGRIELLASFYTTPGFCTEKMHAFLATDLMPGEVQPEFDEDIQVITVPLNEIMGMIQSGEIQDAKSIASLLLVVERMRR